MTEQLLNSSMIGVSVGSQTVTGNCNDYDGSLIIGKGTFDGNMGDLYFPWKVWII